LSSRAAGPRGPPVEHESSGPLLQRACGPVEIGTRDCVAVEGDVQGEPFLFTRSCDTFLTPAERTRLEALAGTIPEDATVDVHGFASEEGDLTFNLNLSCARAQVAAAVIRADAPGAVVNVFMHGATPGEHSGRRSVVVDWRGPAPPEPGPTPPPPANPHVCGPDVSQALANVLADVRSTFRGWTPTQKRANCDAVTGLTTLVMAWDIHELFLPETSWLRTSPFRPSCGIPPAPAGDIELASTCGNSVQVGSQCFLAGTVNYALLGQICRLCNDEFGVLSEYTCANLIDAWTLHGLRDDPGPPTAWMRSAFRGYPGNHPTSENRAHCNRRCLVPFTGSFTWVWEPNHPR